MTCNGVHLYFIRNPGSGAIKIGSSGNVGRRKIELEDGAGIALEVLFVVDGGGLAERRLHAIFAQERLFGEWFECSPRLQELITAAQQARWPGKVVDAFLVCGEPNIVVARRRRGDTARRVARRKRAAARVAVLHSDWWRQLNITGGVAK